MHALRHNIDLLLFQAYAGLKTESAKTYIGVLWWVLDPLLYMIVFYFVFEVGLRGGGSSDDFVSFLLVGLVFWRWFAGSVGNGQNAILGGKGLMQQIYIPKWIFPCITLLQDLFKFSIVLALLIVVIWLRGYEPTIHYFGLVLLMGVQALLIAGTTFMGAALVPLVPDLKHVIDTVLLVLFFLSGIFYSLDELAPELYQYLQYNPMAQLIYGYRQVLLDASWPDAAALAPAALIALLILLVALRIIFLLDRHYPRITKTR